MLQALEAAGDERSAGAGQRHPHAGGLWPGPAGQGQGKAARLARDHHDGVLGPRQRRLRQQHEAAPSSTCPNPSICPRRWKPWVAFTMSPVVKKAW